MKQIPMTIPSVLSKSGCSSLFWSLLENFSSKGTLDLLPSKQHKQICNSKSTSPNPTQTSLLLSSASLFQTYRANQPMLVFLGSLYSHPTALRTFSGLVGNQSLLNQIPKGHDRLSTPDAVRPTASPVLFRFTRLTRRAAALALTPSCRMRSQTAPARWMPVGSSSKK